MENALNELLVITSPSTSAHVPANSPNSWSGMFPNNVTDTNNINNINSVTMNGGTVA